MSSLLREAVSLLASSFTIIVGQQQHPESLRFFSEVASLAAAATLKAGQDDVHILQALEAVEVGQRVFSRLHLSPTPHPESENFQVLGTVDNGCHKEMGLDVFNAPLLPPEHVLRSLALRGPIVFVNSTPLRCDAILITVDGIWNLSLPRLHYNEAVEKVASLKSVPKSNPMASKLLSLTLAWLWDVVVGPILDKLGFGKTPTSPTWPRVWWIPTGILRSLPLHAAGRHLNPSPVAAVDRVISSYTSSLTALLDARVRKNGNYDPAQASLLVSMARTPACPDLPWAKFEVDAVARELPSHTPTIILETPCKGEVLASLKNCSIFHFAGHGTSPRVSPSNGTLLLKDWQTEPLTAEELIHNAPQSPRFLAYLSACSTGEMNLAVDAGWQGGSTSLVTACQLAGFRHVVGAMWEVFDGYSVAAARMFYIALGERAIIDDDAVAYALHEAVRSLRAHATEEAVCYDEESSEDFWSDYDSDKDSDHSHDCGSKFADPLIWAPYIHVGV